MRKAFSPEVGAGVHSIDHFALAVPDLFEEAKFLKTFGLDVQEEYYGLSVRTKGDEHLWAKIIQGEKKRLAYISLGCYAQDFLTIEAQVRAAGGDICTCHTCTSEEGLWFKDFDGNLVQVKAGPKKTLDAKQSMLDLNVPSNVRGAPARSKARKAAPTRLSHIAMFTSDVSRAVDFYTRAVGLRLADRSGEIIAFTYGRHGSDHHLLAFLKGGGGGLHHSSWDLPSVEDLGLGNTQMREAGYNRHWGLGRHVLGSNYFNYVQDLFGQWWEYSAHIDYIEKDAKWSVADFASEDALYLWGPDLPSDFASNTEMPET